MDGPCGVLELAVRPLEISVNPHSQMSYVDALLLAICQEVMGGVPTYAWRERGFGMSDNLIADKTIDIACPWIGGHSRTWHTSADTPEALDADGQGLVARMVAAYAYLIASAGREEVLDFAHLAAARGKAALAAAGAGELERLSQGELDDGMAQMVYLAERHAEAVGSVMRLVAGPERAAVRPHVRALQREVRGAGQEEAGSLARRAGRAAHSPGAREAGGEMAKIRPRRLVMGPVTLDRVAPEAREGRGSPRWSEGLFAVLNWCDGERSLAEVCELAGRELRAGRTLTPEELMARIDPGAASMLEYFEFLRRHEYVTW